MLTSIQDKTVIVTGGSKGIGKGIASVFAKQGANVMIAARGESAAKEARASVKQSVAGVVPIMHALGSHEHLGLLQEGPVRREGQPIVVLVCHPATSSFLSSHAQAGVFGEKRYAKITRS